MVSSFDQSTTHVSLGEGPSIALTLIAKLSRYEVGFSIKRTRLWKEKVEQKNAMAACGNSENENRIFVISDMPTPMTRGIGATQALL